MRKLLDLFHLIEHTRSVPQYGYALSGIQLNDLSNLAEHHYLVSFIGWQLALFVEEKGGNIDVRKVLEFCLIHDLGELFGGDISTHYAKANPKAREHAKAFEAENHTYLSTFFGNQQKRFQDLADEILVAKSDESIIAKLADYIEVIHFKKYISAYRDSDIELIKDRMFSLIDALSDEMSRDTLRTLIKKWMDGIPKLGPLHEMF